MATAGSDQRTDLQPEVEAFIRAEFQAIEVISVQVRDGLDHDGDPVLRIMIAVRATPEQVARSQPSGFLKQLRRRLADLGEPAFPVVEFQAA